MQNTQVLQTETLQTQGYYPTLDTEKSTFYEAKPDDKCASGSLKRLVSILYVQLVATFIVIISSLSIQDFTSFLSDNPHIIQLCSLTFMFSILLLRYSRKISKHIPVNYTLWCLYTLSFGLILASFISINPLNTFVFLGQVTFTIAFL